MDNQLSRILTTNAPPNALEAATLQHGIKDLNGKITHLRSQLQELDRLEDELRRYRGALSPIRRIPPEILAEIFRFALPSVKDKLAERRVVELGLVCKGWRDATLLVHHFWNHLTVQKVGKRYDQMDAWLSRSGILPRTLYLEWEPETGLRKCSESTCPLSGPDMVELLQNGPQIQHLILECQHPQCLQRLRDALVEVKEHAWDKIGALDLIFVDDQEHWPLNNGSLSSPDNPILAHLPPVTSLVLRLPCIDAAFHRTYQSRIALLDVPASVLNRLTFFKFSSDWEGNHILTMLRHCSNLEALVFDTRYRSWSPREALGGLPRISLPKLRTLRLEHDGMFNLLNYIDTPELEVLELLGDESINGGSLGFQLDPSLGNPEGFMQNVRVLHLSDREFVETFELVHVISDLPALTHLKLDNIVVDWVSTWAGLTAEEEQTGRPCLQHVEVLEVLQVKQEFAEEFLPAVFGFFLARGPHLCKLTVSFEEISVPTQRDAERAWEMWQSEKAEVCGTSLEQFGITLRVIPQVDANSGEGEE